MVRAVMGLRVIGINQLGMAVNGFAACGQNPTLSSLSLRRQARELSPVAGGGAGVALQRFASTVGSITDRAVRGGTHD